MLSQALFGNSNPECDGHLICDTAYDITHNTEVARWSDILIGKPLAILALIMLGVFLRWLVQRLIGRIARRAQRGVPERGEAALSLRRRQRAQTMAGVLNSIITVVLIAVIGTMVLSEIGVNIAPIIASAGIIGLALGFGAQSLVKDFLAGIFIFLEDQYGVGDVVDVGVAAGTIEVVTLRMTRLRDVEGTVWYVPNGEVLRVGNKSQNWSRAVVDIQVGAHADLVRVQQILREVAHDIWQDEEYAGVIIEEPEVTGVESMSMDAISVRVMIKTIPLEQWAIARELRQRIKGRLDDEGIELPLRGGMMAP